MRRIPTTMATQHPDNARGPFWERDHDGFISVAEEIEESLSCYRDLAIPEFMWDWEGKYADEAVVDKLFTQQYDFFRRNQLGRDLFLTFRIPNIWHEKGYNLLRALTVILTSEDFARDLKFARRPLFEVILPMTERASQLVYIQKAFRKLARFKSREFNKVGVGNRDALEVIPLVEDVRTQCAIDPLLTQYVASTRRTFGAQPDSLRVFMARSDPAMSSGYMANVLANIIGLSDMATFSARTNIAIYPIIGAGSLVFRGGLNPETPERFADIYSGVRTVTVQSAFRYDYPLATVRRGLDYLNRTLPRRKPRVLNPEERQHLFRATKKFERAYREALPGLIRQMKPLFLSVPRRRERRLHVGFLSYSRQVGADTLPRAIAFTSAFYSLGVPPEFIGTGQALASLATPERAALDLAYPQFTAEIIRAGHYLNKENLNRLRAQHNAWRSVHESVSLVEQELGIKFGPQTQNEQLHSNIVANALLLKDKRDRLQPLIVESGVLRKSLG